MESKVVIFSLLTFVVCSSIFFTGCFYEQGCRLPEFKYDAEAEMAPVVFQGWESVSIPEEYIDELERYGWKKIAQGRHALIPNYLLQEGLELLKTTDIVDVTDSPRFENVFPRSTLTKLYLCRIPCFSDDFIENQVYMCDKTVIVCTSLRSRRNKHSALIIASDTPITTLISALKEEIERPPEEYYTYDENGNFIRIK